MVHIIKAKLLTSGSDLGTLNCLVEPEAQLRRGFVRTEKEKAITSGPSQISISMYHVLCSVGCVVPKSGHMNN